MRAYRDPDPEYVIIEIADTGRGIHAEDVPHLFERFYRGRAMNQMTSRADSQDVSGIGLGLHLARELIEGMNGTISVESRLEAGSIFTVRLSVWREKENTAETGLNDVTDNLFGNHEKSEETKDGSKITRR